MSQVPPNFNSKTSFSTLAQQPITRAGLPGAQIDAELSRVSDSVNATIERLGIIQRDDGQLQNSSVGIHQLGEQALALLSAGGANIRGQWYPGTGYDVGDFVSLTAPAFLVSGVVSPVEANGRYFLLTYSQGAAVFGKDGLYDYTMESYPLFDGDLGGSGPFFSTYNLFGYTIQTTGVQCSGSTSPNTNGFYVVDRTLINGRKSYRREFESPSPFDKILYYQSGRWKCGESDGFVLFQSNPTSGDVSSALIWTAVNGTGPFQTGNLSTTANPYPFYKKPLFVKNSSGMPWEQPVVWRAAQGAGPINVSRFAGSSGLANSSYIATSAHTSSPLFETDAALWGLVASPSATNNLQVDSFIGDGVQKTFVLSAGAANVNNTQVFINGVYQSKSKYYLDGDVITFTDIAGAPAAGTEIEVVCGIATEINITTISEGGVKTSSIQSYAVTERTLADLSVSARTLQANSVGSGNIIAGSITTPLLALGCVTGDHISANSINASMIVDGAINRGKLQTGAVSSNELASGSVSSSKIAAGPLSLNGNYSPTKPADLVVKAYLERAGSVAAGMLQDGSVVNSKYAEKSITPEKLASGFGMPLKIEQVIKIGDQTIAGGSWVTIPELKLLYTRTASSSKVRIQAMIGCSSNTSSPLLFRVVRNNTTMVGAANGGSRTEAVAAGGGGIPNTAIDCVNIDVIDSPPSSLGLIITYYIQFRVASGSTGYINRAVVDTDVSSSSRTSSTMTLTEIS